MNTCRNCSFDFPVRLNKSGTRRANQSLFCCKACRDSHDSKSRDRTREVSGHCMFCSSPFSRVTKSSTSGDVGRYCSRGCYERKNSLLAKESNSLRRIATYWRSIPVVKDVVRDEVSALRRIAIGGHRIATVRPCSKCGVKCAGFMEYSRTCKDCKRDSKKSAPSYAKWKRRYRHARRALEMSAQVDLVDPYEVLSRDGWKCYICGKDTPRSMRGTYEDNAPEVDHVIPLSKGGKHAMDNLRCCCRACNARKGAEYPGGP